MQPMRYITTWFEQHAQDEEYLFTLHSLRALCPDLSDTAFKTLLSRSVSAGHLTRICRGLYMYQKGIQPSGLLLFHAAAQLRADEFNYLSLETVLSEVGVISQVPLNSISIMSSGRSSLISCGKFGTIEFIHTQRKPAEAMNQLFYDARCRLWRASVGLALKDMKTTRRNSDLINWDVAHEFI